MQAELVIDAGAELGEGCVWHDGFLYWLDILPGIVHRHDPATGDDRTVEVGQPVGALVPRSGGGLLLAVRDGVMALPDFGGPSEPFVAVEADVAANRMNDGKCDRQGRFWFSSMPFAGDAPAGRLYRLDAQRRVTPVLDGLTIGNGLAWSADDRSFYFIDSMTHGVDVFDFDADTGELSNRRRLVTIDPADGLADGMTIDAEGCLWVALFSGGEVRRYTPEGALDAVVTMPVPTVTCCTFGGDDLGDLYVTSALRDLDGQTQPMAGGLFRLRPGVTGTPASPFAG